MGATRAATHGLLDAVDALTAWTRGHREGQASQGGLGPAPQRQCRPTPMQKLVDYARRMAEGAKRPMQPPTMRRKVDRHMERAESRHELGQEILAWWQEHLHDRCWLRSFVEYRYNLSADVDPKRVRRLVSFCSKCKRACAMRLEGQGVDTGRIGQGKHLDGCRCGRVVRQRRLRAIGAGRPEKFPELSRELFQYWVDKAHGLKARVPTSDLVEHATVLLRAAKEAYAKLRESGEAFEEIEFMDEISYVWIHRWRMQWGLSWRSVTLVYKVSWKKACSRFGVHWYNCFVMRFVHEELFGPNLLRFLGVDEKPFWFNALQGCKVLGRRGAKEIRVNEAKGKSHERWSGFTACPSWDWVNDPRPLPDCWDRASGVPPRGALFKAESGDNLRQALHCKQSTHLEFSPSGSYRVENIIRFYDWILPTVSHPRDAIVISHDWYACHKAIEVLELLVSKGHGTDELIGGGCTLYGQAADVGVHPDLARAYKDDELHASLKYRTHNPNKLPPGDKQTVLSRGERAYCSCRDAYARLPTLFKKLGMTGALNGDDDDLITEELLPAWGPDGNNMPVVREQVKATVRHAVATGQVTRWDDVRKLLKEYDNHAPVPEGCEGTRSSGTKTATTTTATRATTTAATTPQAEGCAVPLDRAPLRVSLIRPLAAGHPRVRTAREGQDPATRERQSPKGSRTLAAGGL